MENYYREVTNLNSSQMMKKAKMKWRFKVKISANFIKLTHYIFQIYPMTRIGIQNINFACCFLYFWIIWIKVRIGVV